MATKVIPLIPSTNQTLVCTLPVDDQNITLQFSFTYNHIGKYWWFSVIEMPSKVLLLDSAPLVVGFFPAGNLLRQFSYMEIGSAFIVPANDNFIRDIPNFDNLGTDFYLMWSDTE
ncbi:hypothetical protein SAMN04487969_102495 [Paenibacillus algorifonticola]|uniref:Cyanophage baseplate Pam3 plug gp18 domain-containing protein n=1 Tax=Paenibacillus algorifonticola TaxID=684063 RepID=A0A1I2AIF8_9BACL|nr:hypothetical protein [Paenibacillus algorifonticola]SFE43328.1 hypothetical protein SAMN04487969_102495 [Paenibacillus algorifonticola]